jgi:Mg2+ and Co2+ transporter CorA
MTTVEELAGRIDGTERELSQLTRLVDRLTADVSTLVQAQKEFYAVVQDQALNRQELSRITDSLGRAFTRVEHLEESFSKLASEVEVHKAVQQAVSEAHGSAITLLLKVWPIVMAVALAAASGGYMLKDVLP